MSVRQFVYLMKMAPLISKSKNSVKMMCYKIVFNDFLSFLMIFLPVAWIDQSMPVGEWHGLENPINIFASKILLT